MTLQDGRSSKESERLGFSRRLLEALHETGRSTSPTRLAEDFNFYLRGPKVHMHSCRKWLRGESIPTQEKLVVLARMLGVTPDWLRYGESGPTAKEGGSAGAYAVSPADLALLHAIQCLTPRDRQVIQHIVDTLLRTH